MRRLAALLVALVALAVQPLAAAGSTFVWKATSPAGRTIYLAGSVHLLTSDFYPLPVAFDTAFAASDLLVEELDMGEMLAPAAQMRMLQRGMLPASQSLDRILSADTLKALSDTLASFGVPFEPLKQFKPWMLAITLQSMAWQKAGFDANLGLDRHFYDLARQSGKQVQGLETLDFQLSRFDELPREAQERMLVETVKELASMEQSFLRMAQAWKAGDTAAIEAQVGRDLKNEPEMHSRLLVERNRLWLPKIEALFSRPRPALVVVGAAHLVGHGGLLEVLRARGYTLTQM